MNNMQGKFPSTRLRRNRMKEFSRRLVAENTLSVNDLILPLFVCEGNKVDDPINSMPGVSRYSIDKLLSEVEKAVKFNIPAIAIFPQIESGLKNSEGSLAVDENNLVCRSIKSIKKDFPNIGIVCDVALDPFTDHGHDGLVINDKIDNDKTLEVLEQQALVQANAGCDVIAPSDMMDGRVGRIRTALDSNNLTDTLILSYAAKYAGISIENKNHKYWVDIGNYLSLIDHNEEHLRWRQINDIYSEEFNWSWKSKSHMKKFEEMRISSDRLAKYGQYTLGVITLNHIVSSINSLYLSRLNNELKIYSFSIN